MAISKTEKVVAEIEKVKAKLSEHQARLKELEQRKTEIENTEIVDVVRGMSIPLDELAALLQTLRSKPVAVTSGQVGPKSTASASIDTDTEDKEDNE